MSFKEKSLALQKYRKFFRVFHHIKTKHRNFQIRELLIFLNIGNWKRNPIYFCIFIPLLPIPIWAYSSKTVDADLFRRCNFFLHFRRAVSLQTYRLDRTPIFFLSHWSDRNENLWKHLNSEKSWGKHCVLFPVFFIENELFTENKHTAALIFYRHVRNIGILHLEQKAIFRKLCNFLGVRSP